MDEVNYKEEIEPLIKTTFKSYISPQRMMEIVSGMRRTPVAVMINIENLPEDAKKVRDLKLAEDGTVRCYLEDDPIPLRFFAEQEAVNVVTTYKNLFARLAKSGLIGMITIWVNKKVWSLWFAKLFSINNVLLKDEHWSQPVKELRRVLKGMDENILNAISLVFENDMAYRYRLQDIVGELNKNNPTIKEVNRLLDIMIERELANPLPLWKKFRKHTWLFRIYGLKQIKKIIKDINIEEIKFNEEDLHWIKLNKSYNWCGGKNK